MNRKFLPIQILSGDGAYLINNDTLNINPGSLFGIFLCKILLLGIGEIEKVLEFLAF